MLQDQESRHTGNTHIIIYNQDFNKIGQLQSNLDAKHLGHEGEEVTLHCRDNGLEEMNPGRRELLPVKGQGGRRREELR
jgi:hypothetical protein